MTTISQLRYHVVPFLVTPPGATTRSAADGGGAQTGVETALTGEGWRLSDGGAESRRPLEADRLRRHAHHLLLFYVNTQLLPLFRRPTDCF